MALPRPSQGGESGPHMTPVADKPEQVGATRAGPGPRGRGLLFSLVFKLPCWFWVLWTWGSGLLLSHQEKWAIQDFLPNLMANYLPFFVLWPPRMSPYLIYFRVLPSLWDSVFSWEVISQCRKTLWLVIIISSLVIGIKDVSFKFSSYKKKMEIVKSPVFLFLFCFFFSWSKYVPREMCWSVVFFIRARISQTLIEGQKHEYDLVLP